MYTQVSLVCYQKKTIPKTKLAMPAVSTLLVHSSRPCMTSNLPSGTHPRTIAKIAASKPTTRACAYKIKNTSKCKV